MVMVVMVSLMYFASKSDQNSADNTRFNACVDAMQKAYPDPNDNGRVSFLKNCYDN